MMMMTLMMQLLRTKEESKATEVDRHRERKRFADKSWWSRGSGSPAAAAAAADSGGSSGIVVWVIWLILCHRCLLISSHFHRPACHTWLSYPFTGTGSVTPRRSICRVRSKTMSYQSLISERGRLGIWRHDARSGRTETNRQLMLRNVWTTTARTRVYTMFQSNLIQHSFIKKMTKRIYYVIFTWNYVTNSLQLID